MKKTFTLAEQINRREWWHSPPEDKNAYKKRGIFLASAYEECEFYGRPLDDPFRVNVSNPLIDTEENVVKLFFGNDSQQMSTYKALANGNAPLSARFKLDADLFKAAKKTNYDAIAIVTEKGREKARTGKLPKSVELNMLADSFERIDAKKSG